MGVIICKMPSIINKRECKTRIPTSACLVLRIYSIICFPLCCLPLKHRKHSLSTHNVAMIEAVCDGLVRIFHSANFHITVTRSAMVSVNMP